MRTNQQVNRFKDAPWFPKLNEAVVVGGSGGIGSWLSFFLSKIGLNVYVYDFDLIEEHNLGGQLFRQKDVGKPKVDALNSILMEFCGTSASIFNQAITEETPVGIYCFSAFDNMAARKALFLAWKKYYLEYGTEGMPILIDGRLEIEQLQIFCVTPETADEYERDHLFSDSVVEDAPCTMKQTSHTAGMISSLMTAFFTNHLTNVYEKAEIREVPFYYEYVVPMNLTVSKV